MVSNIGSSRLCGETNATNEEHYRAEPTRRIYRKPHASRPRPCLPPIDYDVTARLRKQKLGLPDNAIALPPEKLKSAI